MIPLGHRPRRNSQYLRLSRPGALQKSGVSSRTFSRRRGRTEIRNTPNLADVELGPICRAGLRRAGDPLFGIAPSVILGDASPVGGYKNCLRGVRCPLSVFLSQLVDLVLAIHSAALSTHFHCASLKQQIATHKCPHYSVSWLRSPPAVLLPPGSSPAPPCPPLQSPSLNTSSLFTH